MDYDVVVIGGGPSGLMAAISAAEMGSRTLLVEKGRKLGNKLAISGGGRCNVTNRLPQDELIRHIPGNGKFLYGPLSVFDNYDIIEFFENLGVGLKEEDHGRMFPVSNSAKSVVDTLINKLKELNVIIRMDTPVKDIIYGKEYHTVNLKSEEQIRTRSLVIAVGGKSVPHTGSTGDGYAWAKEAGHTITELYPTEVALTSKENFIQSKVLQGLSLRNVALSVLNKNDKPIITHQMDMIFTHFGISGPAVLRCSQYVVKELMQGHSEVQMHLDARPDLTENELLQEVTLLMDDNPRKTVKNTFKGFVPERYLMFIMERHGVSDELKCGNLKKELLKGILNDIKNFEFIVDGSLSIEKAFVTGGGISTKEIVPKTMGSKLTDRVYFCGEILDIHGYTGGYNITSSFVTGRLAGTNAAYSAY